MATSEDRKQPPTGPTIEQVKSAYLVGDIDYFTARGFLLNLGFKSDAVTAQIAIWDKDAV